MFSMIPRLPLALFENLFDGPDIIIVLVIALLFFGNRLPGVAKSLGRSIFEFKKGLTETKEELDRSMKEPPSDKPEVTAPPSKVNPPALSQGHHISDEP
ncbi:MAG: Sec-independent protein translocase subunit TatA/TatB [Phycisphaerae bacterium]